MELVSDAWAGLGAAFGPAVVCSLFWKRTNLPGVVTGIISGGVFVLVWDYLPLAGGQTLSAATGIYSLLLGFVVSLFLIVVVSLCTKAPDESITAEFERVQNYTE
jgi:sodium/proline symporter